MNSVEDLTPDCLGHAGLVYEYTLVGITLLSAEESWHQMRPEVLEELYWSLNKG